MFQPQQNVNSTPYRNQFKNDNSMQYRNNFQSNASILQSPQAQRKVRFQPDVIEIETVNSSVPVTRPITKNQYYVQQPMNVNQKDNFNARLPEKNQINYVPPLRPENGNSKSKSSNESKVRASDANNDLEPKPFGSTERDKMFIFTGTVERVLKWHKIFQNHICIYEVIASVVSIKNGSVPFQRTMLLRDRKGPILQVVYYSVGTHIDIENFHIGQMLRCVGRMTGPNVLTAITMRTAAEAEIENLQRLCYVCDHAISHFIQF